MTVQPIRLVECGRHIDEDGTEVIEYESALQSLERRFREEVDRQDLMAESMRGAMGKALLESLRRRVSEIKGEADVEQLSVG